MAFSLDFRDTIVTFRPHYMQPVACYYQSRLWEQEG